MQEGLFNLIPSSNKEPNSNLNFSTLSKKFKNSGLVHFFEDGTKMNVPSEITPPKVIQIVSR